MRAPSEKHLEDWIVANPEKFYVDGGFRLWNLAEKVIKRQAPLPNGRPDLIVKSPYHAIAVVELKQGEIKSDTVAQCLRYMHDLQEIFSWVRENADYYHGIDYKRQAEFSVGELREIAGVVVGSSMSDSNLVTVCNMTTIAPVLYDFDGENYTFQFANHSTQSTVYLSSLYSEWAEGAIGDAMLSLMMERIEAGTAMNGGA